MLYKFRALNFELKLWLVPASSSFNSLSSVGPSGTSRRGRGRGRPSRPLHSRAERTPTFGRRQTPAAAAAEGALPPDQRCLAAGRRQQGELWEATGTGASLSPLARTEQA